MITLAQVRIRISSENIFWTKVLGKTLHAICKYEFALVNLKSKQKKKRQRLQTRPFALGLYFLSCQVDSELFLSSLAGMTKLIRHLPIDLLINVRRMFVSLTTFEFLLLQYFLCLGRWILFYKCKKYFMAKRLRFVMVNPFRLILFHAFLLTSFSSILHNIATPFSKLLSRSIATWLLLDSKELMPIQWNLIYRSRRGGQICRQVSVFFPVLQWKLLKETYPHSSASFLSHNNKFFFPSIP